MSRKQSPDVAPVAVVEAEVEVATVAEAVTAVVSPLAITEAEPKPAPSIEDLGGGTVKETY